METRCFIGSKVESGGKVVRVEEPQTAVREVGVKEGGLPGPIGTRNRDDDGAGDEE
jgi:hypothetical protein